MKTPTHLSSLLFNTLRPMSKTSENEIQDFLESFRKSAGEGVGDLVKDLCIENNSSEILRGIIYDKMGKSEDERSYTDMCNLEDQLLDTDNEEVPSDEEDVPIEDVPVEDIAVEDVAVEDVAVDDDSEGSDSEGSDSEDSEDDEEFNNVMKQDILSDSKDTKDTFGANTARTHGDVLKYRNISSIEKGVVEKTQPFDVDRYDKLVASRVHQRILSKQKDTKKVSARVSTKVPAKITTKVATKVTTKVPGKVSEPLVKKRKIKKDDDSSKGRFVVKFYGKK